MVMEALVVLRELALDYEVIVIENGSTDYAWDVLDELERLYGDWGVDNLDRLSVFDAAAGVEQLDDGGGLQLALGFIPRGHHGGIRRGLAKNGGGGQHR